MTPLTCFCGAAARNTSKERGRFNRRHRPLDGEQPATWNERHKTWVEGRRTGFYAEQEAKRLNRELEKQARLIQAALLAEEVKRRRHLAAAIRAAYHGEDDYDV